MDQQVIVQTHPEYNFLRPRILSNLCRVGNNSDGGYILTQRAIDESDNFISLGLGENWTFEKQISRINSSANIDIYDDTVGFWFFVRKMGKGLVKFSIKKTSSADVIARFNRLSNYAYFWMYTSSNRHHRIRITKDIFQKILCGYSSESRIGLKVDIEGSEWEILPIIEMNKSRFEFILLEVHEFHLHVAELEEFLAGLNSDFVNAHLHANNFGTLGNNGFPSVFELSLIKKSNAVETGTDRHELPVADFDTPNARNRPDFAIYFEKI